MKNRYHIQKSLTFLLILLCAGLSINVQAQNGWERMEDMNMERAFFNSCVIGNRIYVFGGSFQTNNYLSSVEVYDITTNKWTTLENMPKIIETPHVCTINGMIYIIGGFYGVVDWALASDFNYAYDPESGNYFLRANCPQYTAQSPSCVLNDKGYVFGNRIKYNPWSTQKKVCVYDPVTDKWDSLPDMNFEHTDGDAVSLNNKIYLIGGAIETCQGFTFYGLKVKSEMFDPETGSYATLKDMHFPVSGHSSVVHNNKVYVFGGDTASYRLYQAHGTGLIQEYVPATDTWRLMKGMPCNRFAFKAEKVGDYVYIIGGRDYTNQVLKEVWRFDLSYLEPVTTNELLQSTGPAFTLHPNYPNPVSGSTMISYEIAEPDEVKLDIINCLGQEIITLDRGRKSPGSYSLTWDAAGADAGLYFCRLRKGNAEKVIKLVVLP